MARLNLFLRARSVKGTEEAEKQGNREAKDAEEAKEGVRQEESLEKVDGSRRSMWRNLAIRKSPILCFLRLTSDSNSGDWRLELPEAGGSRLGAGRSGGAEVRSKLSIRKCDVLCLP
jgi:hypothetical protein